MKNSRPHQRPFASETPPRSDSPILLSPNLIRMVGSALVFFISSTSALGAGEVPAPTFVAHRTASGLMVDHLKGTPPGRLTCSGELTGATRCRFVSGDGSSIEIPQSSDDGGRSVGASGVTRAWEANALRVTLYTPDRAPLESEIFCRREGTSVFRLSRTMPSNLDLRGTFQASLRDPSGTAVGWLRVTIERCGIRTFEGAFPESVDPGLILATAHALDSEIEWIEDHTLDAYKGS